VKLSGKRTEEIRSTAQKLFLYTLVSVVLCLFL
jgi:hypothetical protein